MFAGLIKDESFSDAIEQAAAQFGFESLEAVTESGAGDMHLGGGLTETLATSDGAK